MNFLAIPAYIALVGLIPDSIGRQAGFRLRFPRYLGLAQPTILTRELRGFVRDYAKISTSIWRSKKFRALQLNDRAKLLYFYFHTCAQVNSTGCFPLPIGYVVADLGWGVNQVLEAIETLSQGYLIQWNANEEVVRIIGFLEHDPATNPKHGAAIARVAKELPDCDEKLAVIKDLLENKHCANFAELLEERDRLSKAYGKGTETPIPYPSPLSPVPTPKSSLRSDLAAEAADKPKRKNKRSIPDHFPLKQDLDWANYLWIQRGRVDLATGVEDEINKFRDHHTAKGTASADWSASWRTWATNAIKFNNGGHNGRLRKPTSHDNLIAAAYAIGSEKGD